MAKVFTAKQFIDKLYWLANDVPNVYHSGTGWSTMDSKGRWKFDCVVSVKCILWGFQADKNKFRGGTVYKSNGVPDFPCNAVYEICTDVGTKFDNLVAGEYLCMKGTKYNHTGIYLGNGKVFEDTTGWGVNRAIISDIDKYGNRSYQGKRLLKWTYHGKLKYIDYSDEPTPTPPKEEKKYQSYDNYKGKWLPLVIIGSKDYAGNYGNSMGGIRIYGNYELRVHLKGQPKDKWLNWIVKADDTDMGYAGIKGKDIDGVQIKNATYRVHLKGKPKDKWLDWVNKVDNTKNGYAGVYGYSIDAIQIK